SNGRNFRSANIQLFNPEKSLFRRGHLAPAFRNDIRHLKHVGTIAVQFEPFCNVLAEDGRSERTEGFPVLDLQVEHGLHLARTRIRKDGAVAQSAGAEFHPALKPSERISGTQDVDAEVQQGVVVDYVKPRSNGLEPPLNVALVEGWAEIGALHGVLPRRRSSEPAFV